MKKFAEKPRLLICRISELLSSISVFKQRLTHLYWRHVFLILLITGLPPSGSNNEYIEPKDSRDLRERLESAGCTDPSSYLLFPPFFSCASSHCKRSLRFHGKRLITGVPPEEYQKKAGDKQTRWQGKAYERQGKQVVGVRIVGRSSERNSYGVLFELRQENRETHSIQRVRFLLRRMPRIVHGQPMRLEPLSSVLSKAEQSSSAVGKQNWPEERQGEVSKL